ncbi:Pentatricopeptide repeat-containing protein 10 [Durusdinium trenchii]
MRIRAGLQDGSQGRQDGPQVPELKSLASLGLQPSLLEVQSALSPYWKSWSEAPQKATVVLRRLAKENITLALMVLSCMRLSKVEANIRHWNPIIFEYSLSEWLRSLELLLLATKTAAQPDIHSFTSILNAASRADAWQLALDVLQEFCLAKLSADERIYNIAASSCKANWLVAIHLLEDMMVLGLQPDAITYSTLTTSVGACCHDTAWLRALELFSSGKCTTEMDITNIGAVIGALGALQLLSELSAWTLEPNRIVYNAALSALSQAFHWSKAIRWLNGASEVSISLACSALGQAERWSPSLALLNQLPQKRLPEETVRDEHNHWQQLLVIAQLLDMALVL